MTEDLALPRPWFRAVAVADDLGDRLSLAWVVDTDEAHDLVPDACVDVVWLPDGSVRVCGPEVEGSTFRPLDGAEAVGVRFRPGHAAPVLGTAMDEIRDQQVLVEDLLGVEGRRLVEELGDLPDGTPAERRVDLIQEHIRRWVAAGEGTDLSPTTWPRRWRRTRPGASTACGASSTSASGSCLSLHDHLRYGPATLRRILRLQRFLALAGGTRPDRGLAELAQQAGYADQQHLARDAKAIAHATPSQLVRIARPARPEQSHDRHPRHPQTRPIRPRRRPTRSSKIAA